MYFIHGWCYVYLTWLKWADLVGLVMINYSFCHHWLEKKKKIKHFLACTFLNFDHFIGVLNQNRPIKRKRKKILWKKPIPHKEPNSRLLLPGSWPLHNIFFSSYSVFFFWQWWKKEVKPKTPCLKSKCDGQGNSYGSPNQFHQQDDLVGKPHIEYPKG